MTYKNVYLKNIKRFLIIGLRENNKVLLVVINKNRLYRRENITI